MLSVMEIHPLLETRYIEMQFLILFEFEVFTHQKTRLPNAQRADGFSHRIDIVYAFQGTRNVSDEKLH